MHHIRSVLGVACVPVLSGCMMMGGMREMGGMGTTGYGASVQIGSAVRHAEAKSDDLTIELTMPAPSSGAAVAITARLHSNGDHQELRDAYVSLQIRTPSGGIDELRMQPSHVPAGDTYQAQYRFGTPGRYHVTAEGWTRTGGRMVSVSLEADVPGGAHAGQRDWLTPAVIVGGLAMVAMMAVMMGDAVF